MKRAIVSASTLERVDRARAFLQAIPPSNEVLLLTASRGAADELVRSLLTSVPASFGIHKRTFSGWASDLAAPRIAHEERTIATALAREALIEETVEQCLAEGKLPYFGASTGRTPVARAPSFVRALASTIADLRGASVEPSSLRGRSARLADLAELLQAYETGLGHRRLADRPDVLRAATIAAPDAAIAKSPLVMVDVPLRSALDATFFETLVRGATDVLVVVPRGDRTMIEACRAAGLAIDAVDGAPTRSIERARRYLFEPDAGEPASRDASLDLLSAPTEAQETVEVARGIALGGRPFDEIAIVIPSRGGYAAYLETALDRAKIPAFFSYRTRRPHPAGRALLALLRCRLERYAARRFAEYLSLGEVPAADAPSDAVPAYIPVRDEALGRIGEGEPILVEEDGGEEDAVAPTDSVLPDRTPAEPRFGSLATPRKWEAFVGEARGVGTGETGEAYYARRLGAFRATKEMEARSLSREDPDSPVLAKLERDVADAEGLLRFARPIFRALDALPADAEWQVWISHLERLARLTLRSPEVVLAALAELHALASPSRVSLSDVTESLHSRLSELDRPQPKRRYGRVFVGTPEALRGRCFREVYVLGLSERVFPERVHEDPLLFDDDRRALSTRLPTSDRTAEEQRLGLLLAVGSATERAVFSYPRADAQVGRPRVPSFYALDIERAVRGALPDVDQMQRDNFRQEGARLHWPAPLQRDAAIDELEHDLATLHMLLRERGNAGRARYLLDENAHVARALRARFARFDIARLTPSDGLVAPSAYVLRAVKELSLKLRPYAPSSLETYAACPLRFYFHSVLGIARRRDHAASDSLDPAARGTLFHVAIARLAHALREAEMLPIPVDRLDEALSRLRALFEEEAARVALETEPLVARVFEADCTELREDLEQLVRHDFVRGAAMEPAFADLAFGLVRKTANDPRSVATPALLPHGYLLRGAIDSIERSREGTSLQVTDYKTGAPPDAGPLVTGGGEKLQAVLYGLAMISLAGALTHEATVTTSRLYYATRRGGFAERSVDLDADARERALRVLDAIDGALAEGFFPAWPREKACEICDARPACGADEEGRIRRKRVDTSIGRRHLELLRDVRRAP